MVPKGLAVEEVAASQLIHTIWTTACSTPEHPDPFVWWKLDWDAFVARWSDAAPPMNHLWPDPFKAPTSGRLLWVVKAVNGWSWVVYDQDRMHVSGSQGWTSANDPDDVNEEVRDASRWRSPVRAVCDAEVWMDQNYPGWRPKPEALPVVGAEGDLMPIEVKTPSWLSLWCNGVPWVGVIIPEMEVNCPQLYHQFIQVASQWHVLTPEAWGRVLANVANKLLQFVVRYSGDEKYIRDVATLWLLDRFGYRPDPKEWEAAGWAAWRLNRGPYLTQRDHAGAAVSWLAQMGTPGATPEQVARGLHTAALNALCTTTDWAEFTDAVFSFIAAEIYDAGNPPSHGYCFGKA